MFPIILNTVILMAAVIFPTFFPILSCQIGTDVLSSESHVVVVLAARNSALQGSSIGPDSRPAARMASCSHHEVLSKFLTVQLVLGVHFGRETSKQVINDGYNVPAFKVFNGSIMIQNQSLHSGDISTALLAPTHRFRCIVQIAYVLGCLFRSFVSFHPQILHRERLSLLSFCLNL